MYYLQLLFQMDADYDPTTEPSTSHDNVSKRSRKKNSKFAKALAKVKPVFDPSMYCAVHPYST